MSGFVGENYFVTGENFEVVRAVAIELALQKASVTISCESEEKSNSILKCLVGTGHRTIYPEKDPKKIQYWIDAHFGAEPARLKGLIYVSDRNVSPGAFDSDWEGEYLRGCQSELFLLKMIQAISEAKNSKYESSVVHVQLAEGMSIGMRNAHQEKSTSFPKICSMNLLSRRIRVNSVVVDDSLLCSNTQNPNEGQTTTPEAVADLVVFLLSEFARYIVGESYHIGLSKITG